MKPMTPLPLLAILSLAISGNSYAQSDHSAHVGHTPVKETASSQAQLIEGVVKKVDKANAKVVLSHGPTPDGMPGMTMAYAVKDPAWLDKLAVGQKILFGTIKRGNETVISQIEAK